MELERKIYQENLVLAPFYKRFFAFLIDRLILSFVFFIIHKDTFVQLGDNYTLIQECIISIWWQFALLIFAYEVFFVMLYGATFGKMFFRLRILSISYLDSPHILSSCIRALIKIVGEVVFFSSYFLFFFTPFRQTLHDLFAKTIVIENV